MAGDDLNIALIIKAIDLATAPIRKITKNFEALRKSKQRADKAFKQAANLRQAAEGMNTFARAARNALAKPISEFENFEFAMSNVKALSGATKKQFAELTAQAEDLGAKTKFTATEAAEGMGFLAMAGFDANETMSAMPATLALATAATADLGQTADIASNIMGGFNIPATEMTRVADVITKTFTSSNTTLESLAETMSYAAPVAESFGVSMEQTAAMAGLLGNAGIKGSRAGTALNAVMLRLAAPMKIGKKAMRELGIQVADSSGDLRNITDILADVGEATKDMGEVKRGDVLQRLFGKIALPAVLKLLKNVSSGEIKSFTKSIENSTGTVEKISEVMMDNAKGATVQMESALSGLYTTIGKSLEPALTAIKKLVTGIARGMNAWAKEHPGLTKVLALTAGAITILATVITGITFTLAAAATASGVASIAFGVLSTVFPVLAVAAAAITVPIWGIIAIIAALVATVATVIVYWDELVAVWDRFKDSSIGLRVAVGLLMAPIVAMLAPILAIGKAASWIHDQWKPLVETFEWFWDWHIDIVEKFIALLDKIEFPDVLKKIGQAHIATVETVTAPTQGIGQAHINAISAAAGAVGNLGREIAFVASGGEAGAKDLQTSDFLSRTNEGSALSGKAKVIIEFRKDGTPFVASQEESGGLSAEVDTGAFMPAGAM